MNNTFISASKSNENKWLQSLYSTSPFFNTYVKLLSSLPKIPFILIVCLALHYIHRRIYWRSLREWLTYGQGIELPTSTDTWDKKKTISILEESGKRIEEMVLLPDLFVSWASESPQINPHYSEGRHAAEDWFRRTCKHDNKTHTRYVAADFPYFAAIWAPTAQKEEYRIACDWTNWAFAFDDRIDEGELKNKTEEVKDEITATLSLLTSSPIPYCRESQPVRYAFDLIWQRISEASPEGLKRRFIKEHQKYCYELLELTDLSSQDSVHDLEDYVRLHREDVGVHPILPILEYCYGLDLPDYVFENSSLCRIQELAAEIVRLTNDIYSYVREYSNGDDHSVIKFLIRNGMSQAEAYEFAGDAVKDRYREWYRELAKLPYWGEKVDGQVQTYIRGCRDVVLANLNWSFRSQRYFGKWNELARRTRLVPKVS